MGPQMKILGAVTASTWQWANIPAMQFRDGAGYNVTEQMSCSNQLSYPPV